MGGSFGLLLIDTPPGTSDEHISLAQYLSGADGAVLVTTPQEVSVQDVRKEINFCHKVKMPIIGVVENMSLFVCPHCNGESKIFDSRDDHQDQLSGGRKLAAFADIDFLGAIPLESCH